MTVPCPDCGKEWESVRKMRSHRGGAHGRRPMAGRLANIESRLEVVERELKAPVRVRYA